MMRFQPQSRFWAIAALVLIALIWLLKAALLPFVAGMALAYFLTPVVDTLTRYKLPRWAGALMVLFSFAIVLALIIVLVVPLLQNQVGALIDAAPGYIEKLRDHYMPWVENWLSRFEPDDVEKLRGAAGESATAAAGWVGKLVQQIVSGGFALIDIIALTIITPVVAFYALRDWPILTATVDSSLPRRHYELIHRAIA